MDMSFDIATGALTIDTDDVHPWRADLRAVLVRHGRTVDLTGVTMRLTIAADGVEVFNLFLPPEGVRYRRTDQDLLATGRVVWQAGQEITVNASCTRGNGHEVTALAEFVAPVPPEEDV